MKFKNLLTVLILFMSISSFARSQNASIRFELSFEKPQTHYTEVTMYVDGLKEEYTDLEMPVWTPGSYLVREFQKSVESFSASANGQVLSFEKMSKNTWRVYHKGAAQIKVDYKVYAFERSVRTSFIDDTHAFISSSGIFFHVADHIEQASEVKINLPAQWKQISTGLPLVEGKKNTYYAENFDILYDSPFEIGNQEVFTFDAAGVHHTVAMYNADTPSYDVDKLKEGMAKIVTQETQLFGENPNKNYTFIVHNYAQGSGGLEHLNSTVLGVKRDSYATEEGYKDFLELVAHEYFHLWNVKRLRPAALGPFNYNQEIYTNELWIAEGLTSYFERKFMIRAGYYNPTEFVNGYVGTLGTVINTPGVQFQSVTQSSFDAWIKGYRPNENSMNTGISYYSKGTVLGMMLDLAIINASKGKKSLDDVMRTAYQRFYKNRKNGYTGAEFKSLIEEISGASFDDFYAKYINGIAPLDYNTFLGYAGYHLKNIADSSEVSLGVLMSNLGGRAVVRGVYRDGTAWDGGINADDVLLAINKMPITKLTVDEYIKDSKIGDEVEIDLVRDGVNRTLKMPLKSANKVKFELNEVQKPSAIQLKIRKAWMGI